MIQFPSTKHLCPSLVNDAAVFPGFRARG